MSKEEEWYGLESINEYYIYDNTNIKNILNHKKNNKILNNKLRIEF